MTKYQEYQKMLFDKHFKIQSTPNERVNMNTSIEKQIDNQCYVIGAIKLDITKFTNERADLLRKGKKGFNSKLIKIVDMLEKEITHQRKRVIKLSSDTVDLYQFQINELRESVSA
jgi:hypothetical protein|tara:strand:+ start:879 stop:1223 length:345 start_codon:yes stop_codon:yes gene_type:complete